MRFDKEQIKAIEHEKGPCLLIAGPGSGKTTVLTNRIFFLQKECKVRGSSILVLTFTKKAAGEMKSRYLKLTEEKETDVTFGTFHSVFYRILREHTDRKGYRIIERKEALDLTEGILENIYGEGFPAGKISETVYDDIGRIKNGIAVKSQLANTVSEELEKEMRRRKLIDFDDMMTECLRLLIDDTDLLKFLRSRFTYILVDEFQDINRTQYEVVKLLAEPRGNLFAVGDDDQSIYGFRGSDPSFMKQMLKDFKGTRKLYLRVNHRSSGRIVKASVKLIRHNRGRFPKKLKAANPPGSKPVYMEFRNASEEAEYIEKWVKLYRDAALEAGLPTPSAALLCRTGFALKEITDHLDRETKECITAITFHSSKGLEFDTVFLGACNDGITPERKAEGENGTEEERRVFYVAMTRARKHLHILNTKHSYNKPCKKSLFVKETVSVF